ncbi:MAG: hypothetical protein AAF694_16480 [Bacteroidota bacterium]
MAMHHSTYALYPLIGQKIYSILPIIAWVWVAIALIFLTMYGREFRTDTSGYVKKVERVIWSSPQTIIDPNCIQFY